MSTFVDYVRDRQEADPHVLITNIETGGGGREYTAAFTGLRGLRGATHTLKAVTTATITTSASASPTRSAPFSAPS